MELLERSLSHTRVDSAFDTHDSPHDPRTSSVDDVVVVAAAVAAVESGNDAGATDSLQSQVVVPATTSLLTGAADVLVDDGMDVDTTPAAPISSLTSSSCSTTGTTLTCAMSSAAARSQSGSAEIQATAAMCYYCFDVVWNELKKRQTSVPIVTSVSSSELPPHVIELLTKATKTNTSWFDGLNQQQHRSSSSSSLSLECPLFITWERTVLSSSSSSPKTNSSHSTLCLPSSQSQSSIQFELRGCIGTLTAKPLSATTLSEYALLSALRDKRFAPISLSDLPRLRVSVSLLVQYEECRTCHDWTVGIHGIAIRFKPNSSSATSTTTEYSATFLPEVAPQQGWDQRQTVTQLVRKAGYKGAVTDALLQRIACRRYQSSKYKVTFDEYLSQHVLPVPADETSDGMSGGDRTVHGTEETSASSSNSNSNSRHTGSTGSSTSNSSNSIHASRHTHQLITSMLQQDGKWMDLQQQQQQPSSSHTNSNNATNCGIM